MNTANWRLWLWQYGLPLALLVAAFPLTWLIGTRLFGADDPDFFWVLVVVPITAFLTGLLLRPARVWVMPAIVVALLMTIIAIDRGIAEAMTNGIYQVLLIGLPMTFLIRLGKLVRSRSAWEKRHENTA